ncbi:short-subunit dehydrogenase [Constrictibacter sp. MBR-5]|uniref:SDR family NAD(P)-dependent oxidoreductase n=1 Tax=Constrictibacter sp. MBR-5 TaxID=3156467 RepID=UPI003392C37F
MKPGARIWVTGASSGLGEALARAAAAAGHPVVASARSADKLERLAAEVPGIAAEPVDTTDRAAVAAAVAAIETAGPIDVAVLNAGTHIPVNPAAFDADAFRSLTDVNLMGTVHCLEAVLPGMIRRGGGRIAIVASVAGYVGLPTAAAYGMTKAGLINIAESLKPELERHGIVVQLVCPGFVDTPLTQKNRFPMPFLMQPDDAARALLDGLRSDRFEIVFPRRMAWAMTLMRHLPYKALFAITRKIASDPDKRD